MIKLSLILLMIGVLFPLTGNAQAPSSGIELLGPKVFQGLIAHYSFDNKDNLLQDLTRFSFNGHPTSGSQVLVPTHGKYGYAIDFSFSLPADREIPLIPTFSSSVSKTIPLIIYSSPADWSIATWFYHKSSTGVQTDYSYPFVSGENTMSKCGAGPVVVQKGELGVASCWPDGGWDSSFSTKIFDGSKFYLNTLTEGWHHLIVIGQYASAPYADGNVNTYFIDGLLVGRAVGSMFSSDTISSIGTAGLTLDEFRVYNRALSTEEIALLSETSPAKNTLPAPSMDPGLLEVPIDYYRDEVTGDMWKDLPAWRLSTDSFSTDSKLFSQGIRDYGLLSLPFPQDMWKYGLRSLYLTKYACWDVSVRDWMPFNIANGVYYCTNPKDRQQVIDYLQKVISKLQADMEQAKK